MEGREEDRVIDRHRERERERERGGLASPGLVNNCVYFLSFWRRRSNRILRWSSSVSPYTKMQFIHQNRKPDLRFVASASSLSLSLSLSLLLFSSSLLSFFSSLFFLKKKRQPPIRLLLWEIYLGGLGLSWTTRTRSLALFLSPPREKETEINTTITTRYAEIVGSHHMVIAETKGRGRKNHELLEGESRREEWNILRHDL